MLETILQRYCWLPENYNEHDWYKSYEILVGLIMDLGELGLIKNVSVTLDELDKIDSLEV